MVSEITCFSTVIINPSCCTSAVLDCPLSEVCLMYVMFKECGFTDIEVMVVYIIIDSLTFLY